MAPEPDDNASDHSADTKETAGAAWREPLKSKAANKYYAGSLAESPLTPTAGPFSLSSSFSSSSPPACRPSVLANFEDEGDDRYAGNSVVKCIRDVLERVCALFTGNNFEKTEASGVLCDKVISSHFSLVWDPRYHTLLTTVAEGYSKAKLGSVERRILRACLTTYTRDEAQKLEGEVDSFTLSVNGFSAGRRDLKLLKCGDKIPVMVRTVERFNRDSIDMAVEFILSPENVAFLSCGTKKLKLDGKIEIFPAVLRRRCISAMYEAYVASVVTDATIFSATFYRIVARITAGGSKLRKAVDYVVGFLVNDSFRTLKAMGESLDMPCARISDDIDILSSYMKYGFDQRVKDPNGVPCLLHDVEFGINKKAISRSNTVCDDCKAVFHIFARVRGLLELQGAPPETLKITDDCSEKDRLFFGHRLRVINQPIAIQKLVDEMEARCISTGTSDEAIVTLDFKMKLEPLYYREKTVDHYGKRGISWHGTLAHYFEYDEDTLFIQRLKTEKVYLMHTLLELCKL